MSANISQRDITPSSSAANAIDRLAVEESGRGHRWSYPFSERQRTQVASQARLFRAVAELTARESHDEEELLPELLQRQKSLIAFENVIVTWDPRSDFIA